jgi:hypothetical protein
MRLLPPDVKGSRNDEIQRVSAAAAARLVAVWRAGTYPRGFSLRKGLWREIKKALLSHCKIL